MVDFYLQSAFLKIVKAIEKVICHSEQSEASQLKNEITSYPSEYVSVFIDSEINSE